MNRPTHLFRRQSRVHFALENRLANHTLAMAQHRWKNGKSVCQNRVSWGSNPRPHDSECGSLPIELDGCCVLSVQFAATKIQADMDLCLQRLEIGEIVCRYCLMPAAATADTASEALQMSARQQRSSCKECGGTGICQHGRIRSRCKECRGASICQHGRIRIRCKGSRCGGKRRKQYKCLHGRRRKECKECGGASICQHSRIRSQCKEYGAASICLHG